LTPLAATSALLGTILDHDLANAESLVRLANQDGARAHAKFMSFDIHRDSGRKP
jgi:hypothetical protein